jgi:hypothetical protein
MVDASASAFACQASAAVLLFKARRAWVQAVEPRTAMGIAYGSTHRKGHVARPQTTPVPYNTPITTSTARVLIMVIAKMSL